MIAYVCAPSLYALKKEMRCNQAHHMILSATNHSAHLKEIDIVPPKIDKWNERDTLRQLIIKFIVYFTWGFYALLIGWAVDALTYERIWMMLFFCFCLDPIHVFVIHVFNNKRTKYVLALIFMHSISTMLSYKIQLNCQLNRIVAQLTKSFTVFIQAAFFLDYCTTAHRC